MIVATFALFAAVSLVAIWRGRPSEHPHSVYHQRKGRRE